MAVLLQQADFDLATELAHLGGSDGTAGAVISFTGLVRGDSDLHAFRCADHATIPPIRMNIVAIPFASHGGSNSPNSARKPSPIPMAANAVRNQPAYVRSVA